MKVTDLQPSEYNLFYATYISKVDKEMSLLKGFKKGRKHVSTFFKNLPDDKLLYRYEEGKWSIKEVFQHIIDTERVFIYRCFRIARRDKTPLMGFEQDDYIAPSNADSKSISDLLKEYKSVRKNSIMVIKSLNETDLNFIGNASGSHMSARATAFIILGHERHHIEVLKERYLG